MNISKIERAKLETAYKSFLDERELHKSTLDYPLSFDLVDIVDNGKWNCRNRPIPINQMVSGELQEIINLLNSWCGHLINWEVWLRILERHKENKHDALLIRAHFVEPLVFFCMFQPSSTRDRLGLIATNSIHQANLCFNSEYPDKLEQDEQRNPNFPLNRKKCEEQLAHLGEKWKCYTEFDKKLKDIDSDEYRDITRNFRNLASHRIAPRFESGITNIVTRTAMPKDETAEIFKQVVDSVDNSKKRVISYGYGGTRSLSLSETYKVNEKEYKLAVSAFNAYQDILNELLCTLYFGTLESK